MLIFVCPVQTGAFDSFKAEQIPYTLLKLQASYFNRFVRPLDFDRYERWLRANGQSLSEQPVFIPIEAQQRIPGLQASPVAWGGRVSASAHYAAAASPAGGSQTTPTAAAASSGAGATTAATAVAGGVTASPVAGSVQEASAQQVQAQAQQQPLAAAKPDEPFVPKAPEGVLHSIACVWVSLRLC